jgi:hypothetical protein
MISCVDLLEIRDALRGATKFGQLNLHVIINQPKMRTRSFRIVASARKTAKHTHPKIK